MVTRADIESKAKQIEDILSETQEAAKASAVWIALGVVVVVAVAFIVGRKRGRKGKAMVKVYRV